MFDHGTDVREAHNIAVQPDNPDSVAAGPSCFPLSSEPMKERT
jgi:hypothetical protein